MRPSQNLRQAQQQQQRLSPAMIQFLTLAKRSYSELLDKVTQAVEENPALDFDQYDQLGTYQSSHKDASDYLADTKQVSPYEQLISQLDLTFLTDKDRQIAERLIENIDDQGYLKNYVEIRDNLIKELGIKARKVHDILKIIHSFEPDGVGARNLKECLLIQLESVDLDAVDEEIVSAIIKYYLENLTPPKYAFIADELGVQTREIEQYHHFIQQHLSPNPFQNNFKQESIHTIASFKVEIIDGELQLQFLEKEKGFKLKLDPAQLKLLENPNLDPETRAFIEEKVESAKTLMQMIEKRQDSIQKLVRYIVDKQEHFFRHGEAYLKPLQQSELASAFDLSASTVSRLVTSKYIESPQGTFLLKTLCPRNHFGKTSVQLQQLIADLVKRYPEKSDQQLKAVLSGLGIEMARRTVAKYRLGG